MASPSCVSEELHYARPPLKDATLFFYTVDPFLMVVFLMEQLHISVVNRAEITEGGPNRAPQNVPLRYVDRCDLKSIKTQQMHVKLFLLL